MASSVKIPINYTEAAETLKKLLKLSGSPVAFRFATKKEEIPAGMEKLDKTIRHCSMVGLARKEGKIFYSTAENHECNGGAWSLGLREITETLKNGDFYFKLGKFESLCGLQADHRPGRPSRHRGHLCNDVCPAREDTVRPAGCHHRGKPVGHAQALPEHPVPRGRAGSKQSLPVSSRSVPMPVPRPTSTGR